MNAFCTSEILSEHLARTPEGFLLCLSVPICRTGPQTYRGRELGIPTDDEVTVNRPHAEVLSAATIASFEGKPVTDDHPPIFLNPSNASSYSRGHLQHTRPGPPLSNGETPLIADLLITDSMLIEKILHGGKRQVSAGYQTQYEQGENGELTQRAIVGNHVAIVATGRAGPGIAIRDAAPAAQDDFSAEARMNDSKLDVIISLLENYLQTRDSATRTRDTRPVRVSDAYQEFQRRQAEEQQFADTCNAIGARMRNGTTPHDDCRSSIVRRESTDARKDEDWADQANRIGRAMREKV